MKRVLLIILFMCPIVVNANSINSIDMDIYVKENGDAVITEVWDAYVDEGTEGYHPYYNMGNSVISDLSVSMDGEMFTTVNKWNPKNGFTSKAYKASIYKYGSRVDVCFGISEYGNHIYTIKYTISNFVSSLNDYDMIYWNLFPYDFSVNPGNVKITLYSDFSYSDIVLYSYGKNTDNRLIDGKIVINSEGSVSSSEYITLLVGFPKGLFNSSNIINNDLKYYYDMAESDTSNNNHDDSNILSYVFDLVSSFFPFIGGIIVFLVFLYLIMDSGNINVKKKSSCDDVNYFRDIPCGGDIYLAYWICNKYNLIDKKEDFIGTVILKWILDGNIRIDKNKDDVDKRDIIFVKDPKGIELEEKLYDIL